MRQIFLVLVVLGVVAAGQASDWLQDFAAVRESLEHVPRKCWAWWLEDHGYDASRFTTYQKPETSGLRLVGKWGRGPSVEVTGKDTLVVLTLGSEVALLSFADPERPRVLAEIQLDYLPRQSHLVDSLLLTGGNGIQVWNITDPARPIQRSVIPYAVADFGVQDSLVYFVSLDTFFIYSVANPAFPRRVGCYRDSGYVAAVSGNTAVLLFRSFVGFVDVSNPASPYRAGTYPGFALSAQVRGNLCCAAFTDLNNQDRSWFLTLDVSDPANPRQLGRVDSVCGYDIYLAGSLAFVSGRSDAYEEMRIVDIADSTRPRKLGTCGVWNNNWGVWANLVQQRAYIASEPSGLAVVDIANLNVPHVDTCLLKADQAVDIWVEGKLGYVAEYRAGLRILDLTEPSAPRELGGLDSVRTFCETVVASDSFAFVSWPQPPLFRSILVSDPRRPKLVGGFDPNTDPKDMVLKDTFVYLAGRLRFNVVNVARPRQPKLVGSCVTQDGVFGLTVQDTLAYVAGVRLEIVNVANPASPSLVANIQRGCIGVAVSDSFLYIPSFDTLFVYSVADPVQPRLLSRTPTGRAWDVAIGDSVLLIGTNEGVEAYDVSDPVLPRKVGAVSAPYSNRRLCYAGGYLYGAFWDAGIAVYETATTGIAERKPRLHSSRPTVRIRPNPAARFAILEGWYVDGNLRVRTAAGRSMALEHKTGNGGTWLDFGGVPQGVYFVEVTVGARRETVRVVKR